MLSPFGPLWAALATMGFALLFNLRRRDIPVAGLGAAFGWAVSMPVSAAMGSQAAGLFAAATVIGIWAELVGVLLKRPASVYIVGAIIPLVPGGGMYYTMLASVKGETWTALTTGFATLQAAGAIAAGLAISGALARLFSFRRLARKFVPQTSACDDLGDSGSRSASTGAGGSELQPGQHDAVDRAALDAPGQAAPKLGDEGVDEDEAE